MLEDVRKDELLQNEAPYTDPTPWLMILLPWWMMLPHIIHMGARS